MILTHWFSTEAHVSTGDPSQWGVDILLQHGMEIALKQHLGNSMVDGFRPFLLANVPDLLQIPFRDLCGLLFDGCCSCRHLYKLYFLCYLCAQINLPNIAAGSVAWQPAAGASLHACISVSPLIN